MVDIKFLLALCSIASSPNLAPPHSTTQSAEVLFDFSRASAVEEWFEVSDTVREVGKSKATLVAQQTQLFTRAVLFAILNPQENGACFAGMRAELGRKDVSRFDGVEIRCKGAGLTNWKAILRASDTPELSYEAFFGIEPDQVEGNGEAGSSGRDSYDQRVVLLFEQFTAIYRGAPVPDAPPLDLTSVVSFGLQAYGGVYNNTQQSGAGAMELDTIALFVIDDRDLDSSSTLGAIAVKNDQ
eukprot:gene10529-21840_t